MNRLKLSTILLAVTPAFAATPVPTLTPVGTYNTGLAANGAEIISVREKDNLGAITNIAGSIDLLDLSNPAAITLIKRITVNASYGTPNSVAIHPSQNYFLVASGSAGATGRVTAYRIPDGQELTSALAGIQPDSVAISGNGRYAVVANEAEGAGTGNNGGEGSLTLVSLSNFNPKSPSALQVLQIPLLSAAGIAGFSTNRTDDIAKLAITNLPGTLEPESVAFSGDNRYAYVTLQENNGVVVLNLKTKVLQYFGLGQTAHDADLITTGGYVPVTNALTAFREPDGIALFKKGGDEDDDDNDKNSGRRGARDADSDDEDDDDGIEFFVTADEGDTANAAGASGPRGGRTVSVFNAKTGAFVGDTGAQLDAAAALAGVYPDSRSNRGGSEPEVLDVTKRKGRILVAVGLERAASVALIDVTNPATPTVIGLAPTGNNPEGVKFFRNKGNLYVLTANEGSGTVTAIRID